MRRMEVSALLTYIASHDRRTTGGSDVDAWHDLLHDVPFDEARAATTAHFRDGDGWLTPRVVLDHVRRARADRAAREPLSSNGKPSEQATEHAEHIAWLRAGATPAAHRHAVRQRCPWCGAGAGQACMRPAARGTREPMRGTHPDRLRLTVACPACGAAIGTACSDDVERDRAVRAASPQPTVPHSKSNKINNPPRWRTPDQPQTNASDANSGESEASPSAQPSATAHSAQQRNRQP